MDYLLHDKPWMRPCIYNDVSPRDSVKAEVPLDSDEDEASGIPRPQGDRSAVKPVGDYSDDSPLVYRKANASSNTFGVEDEDEVEPDKTEDEPTTY